MIAEKLHVSSLDWRCSVFTLTDGLKLLKIKSQKSFVSSQR